MIPALTFASIPTAIYRYLAIAFVALSLLVAVGIKGYSMGKQTAAVEIAQFAAKKNAEETTLLGVNTVTANKIIIQTVKEVQVIHDRNETIQQQIAALPSGVLLSPQWIWLYNDSIGATGQLPSAPGGTDTTTAGTEANHALSTISENNSTCLIYKQRAEAVIQFEDEVQKNIAQANKKVR